MNKNGQTVAGPREQRLLDAAQALFLRFGFDKTSVAEIARDASVSKGAVYLHFASKELLFEALIRRELSLFHQAWMSRIEADPLGGTLAAMYKHLHHALRSSPLISAMFLSDVSVLGSYLHNPDGLFKLRRHPLRQIFIERMQAAGAIRPDVDPAVIAHIMNLLSFALVSTNTRFAPGEAPDFEKVIEAIGDLFDKALTPPGGGNPEAGKAILRDLAAARPSS